MSDKYQLSIDNICNGLATPLDTNPNILFLESLSTKLIQAKVKQKLVDSILQHFNVLIEPNILSNEQIEQVTKTYTTFIRDSIKVCEDKGMTPLIVANNLSFEFTPNKK